ncbi:hypothetical protein BDF20DRAFT_812958 [Mycotypha africana]|uniref:uncharacterized protein n=1 Tax=Mycotypha africana TaxID=64632 RepID=UPI0022FFCF76|nr:uncharacterized protein BDF20DRAFT_812958 [Mycotypha africana]KAI8991015.1 hypothetical protein BDF20DRAFT_812958 [Mycotypha africana]
MVSKSIIHVIGLNLTVYGLDEYEDLPKGTPVTVLFALHGRLQNQDKMEPISQAICRLNNQYQNGNRYIIVVTFDAPNHGSRLVNKLSNHTWMEGPHRNPHHALDMWTLVVSMSQTVTELIDVLEFYLFKDASKSLVEVWGVLGFSMGGHATFLAAANGIALSRACGHCFISVPY